LVAPASQEILSLIDFLGIFSKFNIQLPNLCSALEVQLPKIPWLDLMNIYEYQFAKTQEIDI
jgi:hypothetical protein